MPVMRYIVWVGASLLTLLFVVNWFLPEPLPEQARAAVDRPAIRIASIQQPPERVVIDANQPTIVPPPVLFEKSGSGNPSPLQSYAAVNPSPMVLDSAKKRPKPIKRREARVASYGTALSNTPAVARGGSTTTVPSASLSFADIISGRLVRNIFTRDLGVASGREVQCPQHPRKALGAPTWPEVDHWLRRFDILALLCFPRLC